MTILENVPLKNYTTFKIGGRARYFFEVQTINELRDSILFAREKKLPYFVLGGGSNVLFRDEDFPGVILSIKMKGISYASSGSTVEVTAGAGEVWDQLVEECVDRRLWGIENLSLIPGSVGGAPIQNIGAYGVEIGNIITEVMVYDANELAEKKLSREECRFSYRNSFFKKEGRDLIVTGIRFVLSPYPAPRIEYKDVAEFFASQQVEPTLENIRNAIITIRNNKLPDLNHFGTAGSFFKNPHVTSEVFEGLKAKYPNLPGTASRENLVKVSAAWLIDNVANLKGASINDASVWEKQALVIVNKGNATAHDVLTLAKKISDTIFEQTKIILEPEVIIV